MKLSALDIRKQEFARVFRGYDPEEVDAFRHMLSQQWHLLTEDIRRLEQRIQDQQDKLDHYRKVEEALEEALQTAREGARQRIEHAEKKASSAVTDAERKADSLIRAAEQRAQRIVEEAEDIRRHARRAVTEAAMRRTEIVTRLRSFLSSEMDLLAGFESLEAQRARMDPIEEAIPAFDRSFDVGEVDVTEEVAPDEAAEEPGAIDGSTWDEPEADDVELEVGDEVEDSFESATDEDLDDEPDDAVDEAVEPLEDGPESEEEAEEEERLGAEDEIRKIRRILEDLDG